jgi:hypothetical protein
MQPRGRADLKYGRLSVVGDLIAARLRGYVQAVVRSVFTVLLMVSLLGIAACGDDSGDEGGTTAAPDVETTSTTAAESDRRRRRLSSGTSASS